MEPTSTSSPQSSATPGRAVPINDWLKSFGDAIGENHRDWLDELENSTAAPLLEKISDAASAHRTILEEQHLLELLEEQSNPGDSDDVRPPELAPYRNAVRERVIAPLRKQLQALDVIDAIQRRTHVLEEDLDRLSRPIPESITRTEPPDLYVSRAEDSMARRVRKWTVRSGRTLSSLRAPFSSFFRSSGAESPTERLQEIPLHRLWSYHLTARLPVIRESLEDRLLQRLGRLTADLERCLTIWTRRIMAQPPESLSELIRELQSGLEAAAAQSPLSDARTVLSEALDESIQALEQDIAGAGSFMLDLEERVVPERKPPRELADWERWYQQATARLSINEDVLTFRADVDRIREQALERAVKTHLTPLSVALLESADCLRSIAYEVEREFERGETDRSRLRHSLGAAGENGIDCILNGDLPITERARLEDAIRESGTWHTDQLADRLAELPETRRTHLLPGAEEVINPQVDELEISVEEVARQAFDPLLLDQMSGILKPLGSFLQDIPGQLEAIASIVRFNIGAADEELLAAETPIDEARAAAHELAQNGLIRSAEALEALNQMCSSQIETLRRVTADMYAVGWSRFHARLLAEGALQERFKSVQMETHLGARRAAHRAREWIVRSREQLYVLFRMARRLATSYIRRGQTVVGASSDDRAEESSAREWTDFEHLIRGFPLIYRHLFSFYPVKDPALLEGRSSELAWLRRSFEAWQASDDRSSIPPTIVTGPPGSGRTSLLNIARRSIFHGDSQVHAIDLPYRIDSSETLAAHLARGLGFEAEPIGSLDDLSRKIQRDVPRRSIVCTVEHLEHLYLRRIGGSELLAEALWFFAATGGEIFWMGTIADACWRLVESGYAPISRLASHLELSRLNRTQVESFIMTRHRRSGLGLSFQPPDHQNPLLRRRLQKAEDEEQRQAILREEYFDQLAAMSGQDIQLLLFYWLRSLSAGPDGLSLDVQPASPHSFAFLQQLQLPELFALKAFLEHGTLTCAEYAKVFGTEMSEGHFIFESLRRRDLIVCVESGEDWRGSSSADRPTGGTAHQPASDAHSDVRYRLRPLLVHPVTEHLRIRRIVY